MPNKPFYAISKEKRIKLIKPALKEFLSKPFSEVTVSSLTDTMGILRTDFYYYFKDKQDIYDSIIDNIVYYTKFNFDSKIDVLINTLFNKVESMTGPRNQKLLLDYAENYSPLSLDYFLESLNKKARRVTSPSNNVDDKLILHKFLMVLGLLIKGLIDADQAKDILNLK